MAQFNKMTMGFYGTDIIPSSTYRLELFGVNLVDAEMPTKHYLAGMGSFYYPVNDKLVAGIGVYTPSGLGAKWEGNDFLLTTAGTSYKWESKVGVVTIAPGLAYKISDQIFVGASLNINYGMFDIAMWADVAEIQPGVFFDLGQQELSMSGWGFGGTFGVLFKPHDMISFGATFRTPSTIKFDGDMSVANLDILGQLLGADVPDSSGVETEITFPMWIAAGIAFFPMDNLTITADVQYTNWSKIDKIDLGYSNAMWQIMMAGPGKAEIAMHWKNATQIRFGAEYLVDGWAFRAGYYWDPSPTPDETLTILLPSYDFNNICFGVGYDLNGLTIDVAVELLMGKERNVALNETNDMPGIYNMSIIAPSISVSYGWGK
jgi:long-chain fatty acid transport protein